MDTTAVNYATSKLNEAFQAIKPTAVELGIEFVEYTVLKVTVDFFVCAIFLAFSIVCLVVGLRRNGNGEDDEILVLIGFLAVVLFGILTLATAFDASFANAYPLMYTIEQLAK